MWCSPSTSETTLICLIGASAGHEQPVLVGGAYSRARTLALSLPCSFRDSRTSAARHRLNIRAFSLVSLMFFNSCISWLPSYRSSHFSSLGSNLNNFPLRMFGLSGQVLRQASNSGVNSSSLSSVGSSLNRIRSSTRRSAIIYGLSQAQSSRLLDKQRSARPLSPVLSIYQPQLTWYGSIANRFTGVGLSARESRPSPAAFKAFPNLT